MSLVQIFEKYNLELDFVAEQIDLARKELPDLSFSGKPDGTLKDLKKNMREMKKERNIFDSILKRTLVKEPVVKHRTYNISDSTKEMIQLRREGKSLTEIGQKFGITRQAVNMRLNNAGFDEKVDTRILRFEQKKNQVLNNLENIKQWKQEKKTYKEIDALLGFSTETVFKIIKKLNLNIFS